MKRKIAGDSLFISTNEMLGPPEETAASRRNNKEQVYEGIRLTEKEQNYLLPHFTMLIVGKPGSGKTSTIRTMLTDEHYYYRKFDNVLLISPSANKMGIKVKKDNLTQVFDLKWIEQKLFDINKKQVQVIVQRLRDLGIVEKFDVERLNGKLGQDMADNRGSRSMNQESSQHFLNRNLFAEKERFFQKDFFTMKAIQAMPNKSAAKGLLPGAKSSVPGQRPEDNKDLSQYVDEMHKQYVEKLPIEDRNSLYRNCLIILDDMVSQIKSNEHNPLLTQLIFNRRHLIVNGMVSVMIVAQKYTMIPARVRSNASWMLLFRLNPIDFDLVYKDVVMLPQVEWEQVLKYVFGDSVEKVSYHNLGIWVERDVYFKNFKQLNLSHSSSNRNQQEAQDEQEEQEIINTSSGGGGGMKRARHE